MPPGVQCGGGQVYQECSAPCRKTCSDLHLDGAGACQELDVCVAGCNCPEGLVLDEGGQCIPPAMCPCLHGDETHPPGSRIRRSCNTWCVDRELWWGHTSHATWLMPLARGVTMLGSWAAVGRRVSRPQPSQPPGQR